MLKAAIEKILSLDAPHIEEIEGRTYVDKDMTQIGKECHHGCAIYQQMGDCIMPREGVFARVIHGGRIKAGDEMEIISQGE